MGTSEDIHMLLHMNLLTICQTVPKTDMQPIIKYGMFRKSNTQGMQKVIYSLIRILDAKKCKKQIIWPVTFSNANHQFKTSVLKFIQEWCKDFHYPSLAMPLLTTGFGEKFVLFLVSFSNYVTVRLIKRRISKNILSPPALCIENLRLVQNLTRKIRRDDEEYYKKCINDVLNTINDVICYLKELKEKYALLNTGKEKLKLYVEQHNNWTEEEKNAFLNLESDSKINEFEANVNALTDRSNALDSSAQNCISVFRKLLLMRERLRNSSNVVTPEIARKITIAASKAFRTSEQSDEVQFYERDKVFMEKYLRVCFQFINHCLAEISRRNIEPNCVDKYHARAVKINAELAELASRMYNLTKEIQVIKEEIPQMEYSLRKAGLLDSEEARLLSQIINYHKEVPVSFTTSAATPSYTFGFDESDFQALHLTRGDQPRAEDLFKKREELEKKYNYCNSMENPYEQIQKIMEGPVQSAVYKMPKFSRIPKGVSGNANKCNATPTSNLAFNCNESVLSVCDSKLMTPNHSIWSRQPSSTPFEKL